MLCSPLAGNTVHCMSTLRRVVVIHNGSDPTMDQMLNGIEGFRRDHPGWTLRQQLLVPHTTAEIDELLDWRPDGILSAALLPAALLRFHLPLVTMRDCQMTSCPGVMVDERTVGACAAEHLSSLGAVSLMYVRFANEPGIAHDWEERWAGFLAELARRRLRAKPLTWIRSESLGLSADHLAAQLHAMPKPCAIFAGNDHFAQQLLECVLNAGLQVPSDVAILGADDTPRAANLAVPLSSVQVPHRAIGWRAAAILADLLHGLPQATAVEKLSAVGVVSRASTGAIAMHHPAIAAVLDFIRTHAGEPFTVDDAVQAASLSRRSMELRFRTTLGRTILDEIHRVRIDRAKVMLRDGQRSITEIAFDCGFNEAPHFTATFRKLVGATPSTYRKQQLALNPG